MKARIALIAAVLGALIPGAAPAAPYGCPTPVCPEVHTEIRNIAITSGAFTPAHIDDVRWDTDKLSFVNVDAKSHSATDVRCLDASDDTPCAFDLRLAPVVLDSGRQWQAGATVVVIRRPEFTPGETYEYRCTIHEGMAGSFQVVR